MGNLKKILIIDDEPNIRDTLKDILEHEGYFVIALENAIQALHQFDRIKPDLIFLDMRLPVVDGEDLIYILKYNGETAKIVVMTGYNDVTEERAKFMGASYYLKKPLHPETIKNVLKKFNE